VSEPLANPGASSAGVRANLVRTPTVRSRYEGAIKYVRAAAISVLTTIGIVFALLSESLSFFGEVSLTDFLLGSKWTPLLNGSQQSFGVLPLVWGTLYLSAIALAVAIPLGLLCAIYLSEYARPKVRKTIKPVLELLAGVPTVVFGFFALTFFTPEILKGFIGLNVGTFNALGAGIVLGFLVLPTIASISEDAMSAVPQALREGAFGLGAGRRQVSLRVVFPAALSGIVAAIVLGASRAIGETVIILIAGGAIARIGLDPAQGYQSMAAYIAFVSRGDAPTGSAEYETLFAVGFLLFLITLGLNLLSIRLVEKYRQVYD
jgi:phosphate ABC transporter permease protein PstC